MTIVKLSSSAVCGIPLSTDVVLSRAGRVEAGSAERLSCLEMSLPDGRTMVKSSSRGPDRSSVGGALLPLLTGLEPDSGFEPGKGLRLGIIGLPSRLPPDGAAVLARFLLALDPGTEPFDTPVSLGGLLEGVPLAGVSGLKRRLEA